MSLNDDCARATPLAPSRRDLVLGAAGAAVALAASRLPARAAAARSIKIGYISPHSGVMGAAIATDGFMLDQVRAALKSGLVVGEDTYEVQILDRDTQSDPKRAAELAKSLIAQDQVDLVLSTFTPETVNPVADVCEAAGVPCITNACPWEAFYFGRGAKPGEPSPFKWTYHFCFGVAQLAQSYLSAWALIPTNKKVAVMFPNDPDGNAMRAAIIPMLQKGGYTVIDPGPYEDGTADFSAQVELFKKEQCEIYNSAPIPPDFPVFWRQAALAGWTKTVKICHPIKAGLVPAEIVPMGSLGHRIVTMNAWHRCWPYKSLLTGQTCEELAAAYEKATGAQWLQGLGGSHALFEVGLEALKASAAPNDKSAVAKAVAKLDVVTVSGRVRFGAGPAANVAVTPLLSLQYMKAKSGPFKLDMILVDNAGDPNVAIQGPLVPYSA